MERWNLRPLRREEEGAGPRRVLPRPAGGGEERPTMPRLTKEQLEQQIAIAREWEGVKESGILDAAILDLADALDEARRRISEFETKYAGFEADEKADEKPDVLEIGISMSPHLNFKAQAMNFPMAVGSKRGVIVSADDYMLSGGGLRKAARYFWNAARWADE